MKSETKSGRKSVFSKTVLKNLEQSLALAYGSEMAPQLFESATSILNNEIDHMDDRGNKAVRKEQQQKNLI